LYELVLKSKATNSEDLAALLLIKEFKHTTHLFTTKTKVLLKNIPQLAVGYLTESASGYGVSLCFL